MKQQNERLKVNSARESRSAIPTANNLMLSIQQRSRRIFMIVTLISVSQSMFVSPRIVPFKLLIIVKLHRI